jgi:hypothetical protein
VPLPGERLILPVGKAAVEIRGAQLFGFAQGQAFPIERKLGSISVMVSAELS